MRRNRADARRSLDANFDRTAFRESDVTLRSAVTVTVQAEAVGLRTNRLSHHRMMSVNLWDGWKLVRRSYYGCCSRICSLSRSLAAVSQGSKCNVKPLRIPGIGFRNVSYALYSSPVYVWWWW